MSDPMLSRRLNGRSLLAAAVLLAVVVQPRPLQAKGCAESQGALTPPPASLWGELRPSTVLLDGTAWTGSQAPTATYPVSTWVDVENGYIFSSYYGGFYIWDGRGGNEAVPLKLAAV